MKKLLCLLVLILIGCTSRPNVEKEPRDVLFEYIELDHPVLLDDSVLLRSVYKEKMSLVKEKLHENECYSTTNFYIYDFNSDTLEEIYDIQMDNDRNRILDFV